MMACGAFFLTDGLIGSRSIKEMFIKSGMFGKDMNKRSEEKV